MYWNKLKKINKAYIKIVILAVLCGRNMFFFLLAENFAYSQMIVFETPLWL